MISKQIVYGSWELRKTFPLNMTDMCLGIKYIFETEGKAQYALFFNRRNSLLNNQKVREGGSAMLEFRRLCLRLTRRCENGPAVRS